jgi:hypothetical protein
LVDTYWRFSCDGIELGGQARRRAGVVPLLLRLMEFWRDRRVNPGSEAQSVSLPR